MQTTRTDLDGGDGGSIDLPAIFETPYRPDLIERAVRTARANRTQPYGSNPIAGKRTSAESLGAGRGLAMVPRSNGRGRRVPQTVGGRRAHPPKTSTDRSKALNDKERQFAIRSAVAATADADLVDERGHRFDDGRDFPIVVENEFEELTKTREVVAFLEEIGVIDDIERAERGRSIRAGGGKRRGRKYKTPRSILFVTGSEAGPSRAARNLAGADVATAANLSAEDLAPGGLPGRLTIWTENAIEEVADR